jgi:hypothetical protein
MILFHCLVCVRLSVFLPFHGDWVFDMIYDIAAHIVNVDIAIGIRRHEMIWNGMMHGEMI